MANRTEKIVAIVVVAIIIIAVCTFLLVNRQPDISDAQAMIITADEVNASFGGNWIQSGFGSDFKYIQSAKSEIKCEMMNQTIDLFWILLGVFDNESDGHKAMLGWLGGSANAFYPTDAQIGNESYTCWTGNSDHVFLIFREKNVIVWYTIGMPYAVDWLGETSISIAQLQLEKIDQYLAQHPGAS